MEDQALYLFDGVRIKGEVKGYVSVYYILVAIFLIKFNIPKNGGRRKEI